MEHRNKRLKLQYFCSFLLQLLSLIANSQSHTNLTQSRRASTVLVFGDSTVDPGNNNYVDTFLKANFLPYGRDFPGKKPTGRFSNGRLATDFVASYVGLKDYVPAYLDPSLTTEELLTGVSFASAGTGYDPLTSQLSNVIPILKQVEYFREYKRRIEVKIGKQQAEEHIKKAIFVISAGPNDFTVNYFTVPIRRLTYNVTGYQHFVLQHAKTLLQSLWTEGARKMLVFSLPPLGCLPLMITLNSHIPFKPRGCLDKYTIVGRDYNKLLENELISMHNSLATYGARIFYVDTFGLASDIVQHPSKYGFDVVLNGCCGTGYLETSYLCNPLSSSCQDATKYMFFDSIHPSETAYEYLFKTIIRPLVDRTLLED